MLTMEQDAPHDRPRCGLPGGDGGVVGVRIPLRNVSTAPSFSSMGLEAVLEEDEPSARSPRPNETTPREAQNGGGEDENKGDEDDDDDEEEDDEERDRRGGEDADDEMMDNEDSGVMETRSPKLLSKILKQSSDNLRVQSPGRPDTSSSSRNRNSSRKTVSRASSRKSRSSRQESPGSKNVGQSSDSESDMDDMRQRENRSDLDLLIVDIGNEKDLDTDLETEEPPTSYDHTGKSAYVEACKKFGVIPASYFLRHMGDTYLSMKHHGLAGDGMKAIAASLVSNATINTLDISDNWLGQQGGEAVCEMLKENCFISELNLADNHLSPCTSQLCQMIELNDTLRRVNLSGNGLDDTCAEYVANLIMNTSKLEYLNLSHNNLGERAGLMLGPAVSENSCLKELDLSWNHLRRKGAMAVAAGLKSNVFMKKANLSWNGFGLDGCLALMDALKANNVLEEIDITNNRITTEGAVLIGKGLTVNETLKVLKIGKNPIQSAGCWAIASAILKNPSCILQSIDFSDVLVNHDFMELWKQVEEQFPSLRITHGGSEPPLKPKPQVHPMLKLTSFISAHNIPLIDFFNRFDKDGSMNITKEEFRQGLMRLIKETGIELTAEEIDKLVQDLDADGDGEINYSELVLGHVDQSQGKRVGGYTTLRPMTS